MTFTIAYIVYFTVLHAQDCDWLPMRSYVAGMTFMTKFVPYAMLPLPPQQYYSDRL